MQTDKLRPTNADRQTESELHAQRNLLIITIRFILRYQQELGRTRTAAFKRNITSLKYTNEDLDGIPGIPDDGVTDKRTNERTSNERRACPFVDTHLFKTKQHKSDERMFTKRWWCNRQRPLSSVGEENEFCVRADDDCVNQARAVLRMREGKQSDLKKRDFE